MMIRKLAVVGGSLLLLVGCAMLGTSCDFGGHAVTSPLINRKTAYEMPNYTYYYKPSTIYFYNANSFRDYDLEFASMEDYDASAQPFRFSLDFNARTGSMWLLYNANLSYSGNVMSLVSSAFAEYRQNAYNMFFNYGNTAVYNLPWVYASRTATSGIYRINVECPADMIPLISTIGGHPVSSFEWDYVTYTSGYNSFSYASGSFDYSETPNESDDTIVISPAMLLTDKIESLSAQIIDTLNNSMGSIENWDESAIWQNGYRVGRDESTEQARQNGYNEGYQDALDDNTLAPVVGLFGAIAGVPITILNGLNGFAVWNIPIISILLTFVMLGIIIWIVKKLMR